MTTIYDNFLKQLDAHESQAKKMRQGLATLGPRVIMDLQDRDGLASHSLRAVARESGYSAPYLHDIIHGRRIISGRALRRLLKLLGDG